MNEHFCYTYCDTCMFENNIALMIIKTGLKQIMFLKLICVRSYIVFKYVFFIRFSLIMAPVWQ